MGISSASAFPFLSVASTTMGFGLKVMGPEKLIVFPDRVTPTGTAPCSDQVTPLPVSLMTLLPSTAPMPLPPNVASLTWVPISAES